MARFSSNRSKRGGSKGPAKTRRASMKKKFLPGHLKGVLKKRGGYGRATPITKTTATGYRNKRQYKIDTVRHITEEFKKPTVTQEPVVDRPVDLYTNIFTDKVHQMDNNYEPGASAVTFDGEILLNDTENAGTTIISNENEEEMWGEQLLYIPTGRRFLEENTANEILDVAFEDLDTKHLERPQTPPQIKRFQIANIYRTFEDGREGQEAKLPMTDHGRAHVLELMGRNKDPNSFKMSIRANHHLMILVDAFNWYDSELDEENIEGITYKWIWTAGPTNYEKNDIDKIVGTTRLLSIENIQREHIGTYTCEIANKYGKKFSFPIDLDVERPGEMREVRLKVTAPGGAESEILTGQFEWTPNDASDEHDEKVKVTDNKQMYNPETDEWVALYWEESKQAWYREEDNAPYIPEGEDFDDNLKNAGETFEDADAGGMLDSSGYRVSATRPGGTGITSRGRYGH